MEGEARMAFRLEFSAGAERDFGLIFDHLLRGYLDLGKRPEDAFDRAESRRAGIRASSERILIASRRGKRHDGILPGVRHLAIGRAVYPFDIDETSETVRVLAVFFDGQDDVRRMVVRLIKE